MVKTLYETLENNKALNDWSLGKQNSPFPLGPVINCFVVLLGSKIEQTAKNYLLDTGWHNKFAAFQGARLDHVRVKSSSCCSCKESASFDPWHVTRSLQSENVFELGFAKTPFQSPSPRKRERESGLRFKKKIPK